MKTTILLAAATLALAACGTVDTQYVARKQAMAATEDPHPMTGSRFKKPTTERILRAVGNKDYQDDRVVNSLGNDISLLPPKK